MSGKIYKQKEGNVFLFDSRLKNCLKTLMTKDWHEVLGDEKVGSVQFHLKFGDYFGTIATILGLLAEEKDPKNEIDKRHARTLRRIQKDLLFLQDHYKIVER